MTEADTILEHELRLAAETTIQSLKQELEELRDETGNISADDRESAMERKEKELEKLVSEVGNLRSSLTKLKEENGRLQIQLDQSISESKAQIDSLTEEYRKAQAKAHKYQREGRYDAAVQSEVARHSSSTPTEPSESSPKPSVTNLDAFEMIQKQREDIQEERQMYLEFLAEHDDLLALLAQQDVETQVLKEALGQVGGEDVVERAVEKAERQAKEQFGTLIKCV